MNVRHSEDAAATPGNSSQRLERARHNARVGVRMMREGVYAGNDVLNCEECNGQRCLQPYVLAS